MTKPRKKYPSRYVKKPTKLPFEVVKSIYHRQRPRDYEIPQDKPRSSEKIRPQAMSVSEIKKLMKEAKSYADTRRPMEADDFAQYYVYSRWRGVTHTYVDHMWSRYLKEYYGFRFESTDADDMKFNEFYYYQEYKGEMLDG